MTLPAASVRTALPLDVFVIDMDWHKTLGMHFEKMDQSGHKLGWGGYSWNSLLFPDPAAFLGRLHRNGLKATLNLHPASGVQPWEDQYSSMARAMGQDPAKKQYVPFDITSKRFAQNYMDLLHHPLERQGIDFWWLDWQQESTTKIAGINPTWWLNYVHFTDQQREGKRPLLFHRWGGLGNHRYQIGFSGDTISSWDSLAFEPWFTSTAANVGYAYWSHNIGGHIPGPVDPELYTRWVQFGAFSPILRTHTTKNPDSERRIWAYPEPYSSILRSTFQLRYSLEPYVYTEARRTYDTGTAFLHPLYYDYPEAPEAYSNKDEYVFGDSMIVSPVVHPADPATQLTKQSVWIPKGEWVEWPSGKHLSGPATVERSSQSARNRSIFAPAPSSPCSRPCNTLARSQSTRSS
jgi:alpha-glucosidase